MQPVGREDARRRSRSSSRPTTRCTRTTSSTCSPRRSSRPAAWRTGRRCSTAMNQVTVAGANGDQRGFNEHNHEGVVDDDVYFGTLPRNDLHAGKGRPAIAGRSSPSSSGADPRRGASRLRRRGAARRERRSFAPVAARRSCRGHRRSRRRRAGVLPLSPRFVRRVSNKERVVVGLEADGTPNSVTVVQTIAVKAARRLRVRGPGSGRLRAAGPRHRVAAGAADEPDPLAGVLARAARARGLGRPSASTESAPLPAGQGAGRASGRADDRAHREPDRRGRRRPTRATSSRRA